MTANKRKNHRSVCLQSPCLFHKSHILTSCPTFSLEPSKLILLGQGQDNTYHFSEESWCGVALTGSALMPPLTSQARSASSQLPQIHLPLPQASLMKPTQDLNTFHGETRKF